MGTLVIKELKHKPNHTNAYITFKNTCFLLYFPPYLQRTNPKITWVKNLLGQKVHLFHFSCLFMKTKPFLHRSIYNKLISHAEISQITDKDLVLFNLLRKPSEEWSKKSVTTYPAGIYLLKVNNRNNRRRCEICSKVILKTLERRY